MRVCARIGAVTSDEKYWARLLGPVQLIEPDGSEIELPSASQRRLLAVLALHAPGAVRSGWLCEVLDLTPGALRTSVARLRRLLGVETLRTTTVGYRLDVEVDAALVGPEIEAAAGDPERLARALARWKGPALEEFRDEAWAVGDARRLDEIRAKAVEDLAEHRLNHGDPGRAIPELEAHVVEHPYRDRPRGLLMRALAASGRQTEALRAFQDYREMLAETVGIEPTDDLRAVERRITGGWGGVDRIPAGSDPMREAEGVERVADLDGTLRSIATGVGRRQARERIAAELDRTVSEGAGVVLVSGDVGIGKTTLVADLARTHATTRRADVYYGRCDEFAGTPFEPLQSIVGRIVDRLSDRAVLAHAAKHGGDLVRLLPTHVTRVAAPPTEVSDERTSRHLLFEAVTDIVARAAEDHPVMIAIDDLQWAEPAAVHLLRHLARNLGRAPVLLVLVEREVGEAAATHVRDALADLARQRFTRVDLVGLDRDELADLVHARLPTTTGHDVDQVADALLAETAGNPLLADHLLDHWDRSGRVTIGDGSVLVSAPLELDVPATLRDLVWHRVSLLGDGAADILTAAAVLGLEFNERVLATMVEVDASDLAPLLDRAVTAGVLSDHPSLAGTVRFTHALVARALEADLGTRARTRLHARAFAATLATYGASAQAHAPRLAFHARAGALSDEALGWAITAGDAALAELAPDEAARWYVAALQDAEVLGRPEALRADLLVRLGEARESAGDPTALDAISDGARLAARAGTPETLVRAALAIDRGTLKIGQSAREQLDVAEAALAASNDADPATRARLTALVAQSLIRTNQTERRTALANEALATARATGDATTFALVAAKVLNALWSPGSGPLRAALAREATAAVREATDPNLVFVVNLAAYSAATCAGEAEDARACLNALHEVVHEVRDPQLRWAIGVLDTFVATMAGAFADADRLVAENFELGTQIGVAEALGVFVGQSFAIGTFAGRHADLLPLVEQVIASEAVVELSYRLGHAIVCCEVGRPEAAIDLLHEAMHTDTDATPDDFLRSTELLGYAVLALEVEDVEAAAWLYPELVPLAGEVSFNSMTSQGPIAAYAGKLASLLGQTDDAESFLLDALATTVRFEWHYHRATTLLALAQNRFRADGRLDDEARAWLTTAERLCAAHGIAVWAKRAATFRSFASV